MLVGATIYACNTTDMRTDGALTDKPSGAYETHATFTQMEPAAHPEAYGLFIGGANLEAATQKYTYFIVRQDGKYMIKRRNGIPEPGRSRTSRCASKLTPPTARPTCAA